MLLGNAEHVAHAAAHFGLACMQPRPSLLLLLSCLGAGWVLYQDSPSLDVQHRTLLPLATAGVLAVLAGTNRQLLGPVVSPAPGIEWP